MKNYKKFKTKNYSDFINSPKEIFGLPKRSSNNSSLTYSESFHLGSEEYEDGWINYSITIQLSLSPMNSQAKRSYGVEFMDNIMIELKESRPGGRFSSIYYNPSFYRGKGNQGWSEKFTKIDTKNGIYNQGIFTWRLPKEVNTIVNQVLSIGSYDELLELMNVEPLYEGTRTQSKINLKLRSFSRTSDTSKKYLTIKLHSLKNPNQKIKNFSSNKIPSFNEWFSKFKKDPNDYSGFPKGWKLDNAKKLYDLVKDAFISSGYTEYFMESLWNLSIREYEGSPHIIVGTNYTGDGGVYYAIILNLDTKEIDNVNAYYYRKVSSNYNDKEIKEILKNLSLSTKEYSKVIKIQKDLSHKHPRPSDKDLMELKNVDKLIELTNKVTGLAIFYSGEEGQYDVHFKELGNMDDEHQLSFDDDSFYLINNKSGKVTLKTDNVDKLLKRINK